MKVIARLLVAFAVATGFFSAPVLAADASPDPAAMALHLLDYVSVDYAGAVQDGRVKREDEYREMVEFTAQAATLVHALPANERRARLEEAAAKLATQVAAKADAAAVATTARTLRDDIVAAYDIRIAPEHPPDPARGAALFVEHCSACHGAEGRGDGFAARGMDPPPTNFHDRDRMAGRPLHSFFNTITLGVSRTPMPAFALLPEDDRWALAAHVASFGGATAATASPLDVASRQMHASAAAYRAGDRDLAGRLAIQAYLEGFELIEAPLAHVDGDLLARTERAMIDYRALLRSGAAADKVDAAASAIEEQLERARTALHGGSLSAAATFAASFLILVREGVEVVLVLSAIFAFLDKAGRPEARRYVHAGWIAALLMGLATWWVSGRALAISGANREVTEGVTALVSAAMLLYVGWWLHDKSHSAAWQRFIRERLGGAVGGGTLGTLVTISFLAVYREAFETVLFYQALAAQAGPEGHGALVGGLAAGVAVLAALTWAILRWSARLPLALFFGASAALLALLAVVFTGQGIGALQEAGWVDADPVAFIRLPLLGILPTVQTLAAQALVVALIAAAFAWRRRSQPA